FGSSTSLRVDGSPALTSYLTFDVEGVGTPTRAILRIFPNASAGTGFDVHRVQDTTWGESTITFDTAPAVDQAIIGSSGALTLGVPVDVDVTSLVAGNGVVSLALTSAGSTQLNLASRESGANAPQLIVSASIVPPTATATATDTATATETATASATPTETATLTETPAPTVTPTPTATLPPQTDTTFVPAADAYVSAGSPAVNFGSSTSLRVQASPALNSYLTFDIEGVGTPSHVILRIYPNSSAGTGFDVHRVQDARWGESTVTFSNAPAIDAAIIGSAGALTAGVPVDIDVTSAVTGNGLVSFALTKTTATQLNLASRESGANAPQLIVSASIVPPTATATATDTATPTLTATDTATPVATATATSIDTATASDTPTATEIATDTDTPTPTDTPVPAP
ncbi:MAG TPA: DNRLRE domain-containing protein, partial [Dehalococcoidia bacterium]|nr:DNRLRE domain-containing protein [Dehalococcoidia bacterium]